MRTIVFLSVVFALMASSISQAQSTCQGCSYNGACLQDGETQWSESECVTRVCVVQQNATYSMRSVMIQSQGCRYLDKCYNGQQLTAMDSQCVTRRCNVDTVNHSAGMNIAAHGCSNDGKCYNSGEIVSLTYEGNKFECKCYVDAAFTASIDDCEYTGTV